MAGKAMDSSANSSPSNEDAHPISKIVSSSDFMRFKRGSNPGTGKFQTSTVTFTTSSPSSMLQGTESPECLYNFSNTWRDKLMHFHNLKRTNWYMFANLGGEKNFPNFRSAGVYLDKFTGPDGYCTPLQKELEPYDCVLFEMVRENLKNGSPQKVTNSPLRRFCILSCIQRLMAILLGLSCQLDCLKYRAENWYDADLDEDTFKLLQRKKGENFFTVAIDVAVGSTRNMLKSMIPPKDIGPWRSKILWASRGLLMPLLGLLWASGWLSMPLIALFIGGSFLFVRSQVEYPEIEALLRVDFGAALKLFLAKNFASG